MTTPYRAPEAPTAPDLVAAGGHDEQALARVLARIEEMQGASR